MRKDPHFRFLNDGTPQNALPPIVHSRLTVGHVGQDADIVREIQASLDGGGTLPFEWGPQEQHFVWHAPESEVIPYLIYRYKMAVFPRRRIVADFPVYLLIEPASPCNLRCVMCFQVDPSFTKKSAGYMGYMDMGLYRDIVDQAAEGGTRAITLASRGEPTLHKELPRMLRYAADKGKFFDIKLNTNGTLLDDRIIHGILDAGTSIVVLSVDSIEPVQYSRIRVRGDFDTVVENATRFVQIRDQFYPSSRTEIRAAGVKIGPDQDEGAYSSFWSKIVDTVAFADAEARWDTYNNPVHPDLATPCSYLWERMYVWWDGTINPCDVDYRSNLKVSTGTLSLKDAWHGAGYHNLREAHLTGKRGTYNPCDRCGVGA